MSTKAFGYVNEDLKEIEEKHNKSKKRMEEIKEAKREAKENRISEKSSMKNITINFPELYDVNIQKLIKLGIHPSRSEAIRIALREFLNQEYGENLELLGFFDYKK